MALDIHDYRFIGLANTVAMEDFSASFNDDTENSTCLALLDEYKAAGSPKDKRRWLQERLDSIFTCATTRPIWVESTPMWPFLNGKAMTFIHQFEIGDSEVAASLLVPNATLFVFGLRVPCDGGWRMTYRVVQQHFGLP